MFKLFMILFLLAPTVGYADCDFSLGISKVEDGYLYSNDCHREVGKKLLDLKDREKQIELYKETIQLKDLHISKEQQRADLWKNTAFKLEDRMISLRRWDSLEDWLYFGAGVLVTGVAAWSIGQAAK